MVSQTSKNIFYFFIFRNTRQNSIIFVYIFLPSEILQGISNLKYIFLPRYCCLLFHFFVLKVGWLIFKIFSYSVIFLNIFPVLINLLSHHLLHQIIKFFFNIIYRHLLYILSIFMMVQNENMEHHFSTLPFWSFISLNILILKFKLSNPTLSIVAQLNNHNVKLHPQENYLSLVYLFQSMG